VEAVFLDVGETLLDETRMWSEWAEWLGVSHLTMMAALGATIVLGEDHLRAFHRVRPGFDLDAERRARDAAGRPDAARSEDLYPDALPCLARLRERRLVVGVAGNTSVHTERMLRGLVPTPDIVTSSASLGAAKPSPAFFDRLVSLVGIRPAAIAYVGDRIDNDVAPAAAAGMVAVHVRRGPWARLQPTLPEAAAALRIDTLADLPAALDSLRT
jgi:FMN phosphatase YigB (HAD superfamily)